MADYILNLDWVSVLLILFTGFLVYNDRAFSRKIRAEFVAALSLCLILTVLSFQLGYGNLNTVFLNEGHIMQLQALFRPSILLILIATTDSWNRQANWLLAIPLIVNIYFTLESIPILCVMAFAFYVIVFVVALFNIMKKGDKSDYIFALVIFCMLIASAITELTMANMIILNKTICIITCTYYYYLVMRTYKRDGLTGLFIRHNLKFEMIDLYKKDYDIALIDVDNFKLINDKYGHDKGDEALVTITRILKKYMPKGCRMYRYGGDEFVIISRKVSEEQLVACIGEANMNLGKENLRVSFGLAHHTAMEDGLLTLAEADKQMYENKHLLKSEDIWDDMTGLLNFRGFLDELDTFRRYAAKEGHYVYLLGLDVDRLNNINMAYGYTEGNLVIATVARASKQSIHGRDFIGHLGSDEFVVAIECEALTDEYVDAYINEIQENIDTAYELTGKDYSIILNVSRYGISDEFDLTSEECVNNVLYMKQEDKENRRKYEVGDVEQDYNNEDEKVVLDILDNNKLKYAFQPIVSAKDGEILAYESLMRSDTDVMVSPLKILKYAERNKRSYEVEKLTFFNVFSRVFDNVDFPEDKRIFINSIPGFLLDDSDYEELRSKYSDKFEQVVIEITEQREIDDDALVSINTRRAIDGFNLAIDDYGSGCSNTNSLLRYTPQIVKLDRLLITGIDRNDKKQFFVNSIISFARENDMLILAEGVETEKELKTVIRLGVDLIQGYITAKPSFEIIDHISADIKRIIIDENLKAGTNQRMVYTAASNCELSVVQLAMENYTKLNLSGDFITLNGSSEYTADMVIRIKDGTKVQLTLKDVQLNSVDDEPCITVGEGASLILNLEGNNRINHKGIYVPEGSSLTVIGPGNLELFVKGHECYAIGTDTETAFGNLLFKNSGIISINVDGEECIGIGGGLAGANSAIDLNDGVLKVNVAGVHAIAVGMCNGNIPIRLHNVTLTADFRVASGIVIGSLGGYQNINLTNFNIEVSGSGSDVCGIGSLETLSGKIVMSSGSYKAKLSGHNIYLLGCKGGVLDIDISHASLDLVGEGDNVLGFGSFDKESTLVIQECSNRLIINASTPLGFGTSKNTFRYMGPMSEVKLNGEEVPMTSST